jgi:hypothetical protein
MERTIGDGIDVGIVTARANHAFGPATFHQILFAGILVRKQVVELIGH